MNGSDYVSRWARCGMFCLNPQLLWVILLMLVGVMGTPCLAGKVDMEPPHAVVTIRVGIPCGEEVTLGSALEGVPLRLGEDLELSHATFRLGEDGEIVYIGPDGGSATLGNPVIVNLVEGEGDIDGSDALIWLDDNRAVYKGLFELSVDSDGALSLVNVVDLEDYVAGVVPYEIGVSSPLEALRAQAVVARTEALGSLDRHVEQGYDLCATTHCQVYKGAEAELSYPIVRQAVDSTVGEILFYGDAPAEAANYHACCGGLTETAGDLWGADVPYMHTIRCNHQSDLGIDGVDLSDEDEVRAWIETPDPADCCYGGNGYRWRVEYSQETLTRILEPVIGNGTDVNFLEVAARTSRGAAVRLIVHTSAGDYEVSGEYAIRVALGGTRIIKSGVFAVNTDADPPGKFEFVGAGYGHGVGMCQYGARAMARQGYDYKAILEKYYPGTTVGSLGQ